MGVPGRGGAEERSALHPTVLVTTWMESRDKDGKQGQFPLLIGGVVDCWGGRGGWGLGKSGTVPVFRCGKWVLWESWEV
jgi:hypothetical protein